MRKRPRWRVALTIIGALVALGLWSGYLATRVPAVQRSLILKEHRELRISSDPVYMYGGWGWAERSQLHAEATGSWLLRDPELVRHRLAELKGKRYYVYPGEWALLFAAMRKQGKSNTEIQGSYEGLTLSVATLAAESDPPNWWSRADWLGKAAGARPQGSFRLGLLGPEDVSRILGELSQCDQGQTAALVAAVLRNEDAFTPEQRDDILQRWLELQRADSSANKNSVPSLEQSLAARESLRLQLAPLEASSELTVSVSTSDRLSAAQRHEISETLLDFLRSLGYRPRLVERQARVFFQVDFTGVAFKDVAVEYSEQETTTRRVARQTYSRVGGSRRTYHDETSTETRWLEKLEDSEVPSLVVKVRVENSEQEIVLPPFGDFNESTRDRFLKLLAEPHFDSRTFFTWNWCLENYALTPWRFGLQPFHHEWSLEEL